MIAAPRDAIEAIIDKHPLLADLLSNEWLQLVAVEEDTCYRFTAVKTWDQLTPDVQPISVGHDLP